MDEMKDLLFMDGIRTEMAFYKNPDEFRFEDDGIFYVRQFEPEGFRKESKTYPYSYDFDGNYNSGLIRYLKIDATELDADQIDNVVEALESEANKNSDLKFVQIGGFDKNGRRYITLGGESYGKRVSTLSKVLTVLAEEVVKEMPVDQIRDESCNGYKEEVALEEKRLRSEMLSKIEFEKWDHARRFRYHTF